jgi:signal peptidase II
MSAGRMLPGAALAAGVLLLDQVTKALANELLNPPSGGPISVTPFFDLRLGYNRGVSFGLLATDHPAAPWVLSGLAVLIVAVLLAWMRRAADGWERFALGLVIGGALGNVADRLRQGMVTDFLDFHVAGWHWPAFNLADGAIVLGAAILLGRSLLEPGRPAAEQEGRRPKPSGNS